MSIGLPLLLACLAALESALFAGALWLFLAGTVIGGVAVGLIFRGGLSEINRLAEPRHRAAVVSTFFAAAYLGLGLPPVLTGLISQLAGTGDASAWTSGITALIFVAAIAVVLRTFGATRTALPPSTPSDSWCCPAEPAGRPLSPTGCGQAGATGLIQRTSLNRAKSLSLEQTSSPCSMASAARWASLTTLPRSWYLVIRSVRMSACPGPSCGIQDTSGSSQSATKPAACSGVSGCAEARS
jgi:MFS family permease